MDMKWRDRGLLTLQFSTVLTTIQLNAASARHTKQAADTSLVTAFT